MEEDGQIYQIEKQREEESFDVFPLLLRYDVIAKMETFSEDTQFTLAQVGIIS